MIVDSGCQSTVIPSQMAYEMGLKKRDFLPVRMKMSGAGSNDLCIMGAIILDISTKDEEGMIVESKQFYYVSGFVKKLFLSKQAMEDLGIIDQKFPLPASKNTNRSATYGTDNTLDDVCECPRRQHSPPSLPSELPSGIHRTENDVARLKYWLLEYYQSSSFNKCKHQPLPKMTGAPLRLYMDPEAIPVAIQ